MGKKVKAEVVAKGLIIDDEEQKVGSVIEVSEGLCERSTKLKPASRVSSTTRATGNK